MKTEGRLIFEHKVDQEDFTRAFKGARFHDARIRNEGPEVFLTIGHDNDPPYGAWGNFFAEFYMFSVIIFGVLHVPFRFVFTDIPGRNFTLEVSRKGDLRLAENENPVMEHLSKLFPQYNFVRASKMDALMGSVVDAQIYEHMKTFGL